LTLPHGGHRREFLAPFTLRKFLQGRRGRVCCNSLIDWFKCGSQRLAILPAGQAERIADQVHDAGLDLGLRINGFDRFRKAA
jgi:hypothetical protein